MTSEHWPEPCTCTPGNESNGWHEVRSPECKAHERKQWSDMLKRLPEMVAAWRAKR
jgi:hypothetical protein